MQAYRPNRHEPRRSFAFDHPALGRIQGVVVPGDKVVQFHAIPYASVPARFQHCVLATDLGSTDRSFEFPGYVCPHTFTMEDVHSGGVYPREQPIDADEFGCLTVTLSVPLDCLAARSGHGRGETVPVVVYIHGGAFHVGKADAVHDTALLVAQSIDDDQPVVAASLQYRVGALGFLAAPGGAVNVGLRDQRTGLEWLQRFVGGFGGDAGRVTVFGESAGGYSISCHMLAHPAPTPLFRRAAVMSGVLGPLMVPVSRSEAGAAFDDICGILGIEGGGRSALEALESVPVQKLVEAGDAWTARGHFWRPVVDPSFFAHDNITWDAVPALLAACPWVDALIVGNTAFEGTPYVSVAASLTPSTLRSHMLASLSEQATTRVLETYGIEEDMDHNLFTHAATRWLGDVIFDAPIHALCAHLPPSPSPSTMKIYRYIFDIGNPFIAAPFYNTPHHWVDVYFLFRTLQFRFPTRQLRSLSDEHARLWTRFARGDAPWGECAAGTLMVGRATGWAERSLVVDGEMAGRDWGRLDRLWDAWGERRGDAGFLPLKLVHVLRGGEG